MADGGRRRGGRYKSNDRHAATRGWLVAGHTGNSQERKGDMDDERQRAQQAR